MYLIDSSPKQEYSSKSGSGGSNDLQCLVPSCQIGLARSIYYCQGLCHKRQAFPVPAVKPQSHREGNTEAGWKIAIPYTAILTAQSGRCLGRVVGETRLRMTD
jgi:hypothetical protein